MRLLIPLVLAFCLLLVAISALPLGGAVAAPAVAPTPISNPGSAGTPSYITFWNSQALAADTRSNPLELGAYNRADLQYIIDQGASTNTITLTMQTSCDGQNWDSGVNLVASNSADATAVTSLPNFCRYTAIYADVVNTNTVTVTVKGAAKQ